jgi:hypothetical protein
MAAVVTAITGTGAFTGVEAHELLTHSQLSDALVLAGDASRVYNAAVSPDAVP